MVLRSFVYKMRVLHRKICHGNVENRMGGRVMYIDRHLETQILEASKYYPVVMVCGQRQVGKSTMLNHLREKWIYWLWRERIFTRLK